MDYLGIGGTMDLASGYSNLESSLGGYTVSPADDGGYSVPYSGGGIVGWQSDAIDEGRLGSFYPNNGQSWDVNAATLGITRGIDSVARAYANIKGAQAATYAGQNGLTYVNGRQVMGISGNMLPMLLALGVAVFLIAKA